MMIQNKITGQNERIEEQDICDLENVYHFTFPDTIKQFYLQNNGGRLEKSCFATVDGTHTVSSFYSIKHGSATLNDKMRLNYVDKWWSKELVPYF